MRIDELPDLGDPENGDLVPVQRGAGAGHIDMEALLDLIAAGGGGGGGGSVDPALTGVAGGETNLGAFSSPSVPDNATIKAVFEAIGSVVDTNKSDLASTAANKGAALVGFIQSLTGAVARTVLGKMRDTVSVLDFIPTALHAGIRAQTETTLLTSYIQAAFNSGAAKIIFPQGLYYTGSLTVPDWLHIQGEGYQPTIGGSGRAVELRFSLTADVAGLTCGYNPTFENIYFQNFGGTYNETTKVLSGTTSRAIKLTQNALIKECSFAGWHKCIATGANTYYLKTSLVHFNRCTNGYFSEDATPYNIHIDQPHSTFTSTFITGNGAYTPRNIKIFGGSIEWYSSVASNFLDLSIFGTYFETGAPQANVTAISPGISSSNVSLFGCLVYMNETTCFVDMSGLQNVGLTSHGNVFDGAGQAGGFCFYLPTTGSVSLAGDRFGTGHTNTTTYVNSIVAASLYTIAHPVMPAGNTHVDYSDVFFTGRRGIFMLGLAAAPAVKVSGEMFCADGATWDPLAIAGGRPYWTVWQGDRWRNPGG